MNVLGTYIPACVHTYVFAPKYRDQWKFRKIGYSG